ncbi:MAG: hypothetical protein IPN83_07495 [Holophagales bacterium]|jgi:photosystem II stability/assembly factor-like uncharacterized protein|nr:hypothetical protein [Holophagales bacterium]
MKRVPRLLLALTGIGAAGALLAGPPAPPAARVAEPLQRPAIASVHARRQVLLDVARAGERLVVVGERGIVLLSDDSGATWRQGKVPVSVTLTAVRFVNAKTGWAVGHYGAVLRTDDAGESWTLQLDGVKAAELALAAAKAAVAKAPADDPKASALLAEAERLVADGPDKPFLDLWFESETAGFVLGAYNLILRTEDGGKSWIPWMDRVENPKVLHLYALRPANGALYIAGEQGLLLKSTDAGQSFRKIDSPYAGSFFSLLPLPTGEVLVAGLRGNVWVLETTGQWRKVEPAPPVNVTSSLLGAEGKVYLTNFAGQVWVSEDGARSVHPIPVPALPPLTRFLPLPDGYLALTLQGLMKLPPAGSRAAAPPADHAGGVR